MRRRERALSVRMSQGCGVLCLIDEVTFRVKLLPLDRPEIQGQGDTPPPAKTAGGGAYRSVALLPAAAYASG